jgi:hypothetical protein
MKINLQMVSTNENAKTSDESLGYSIEPRISMGGGYTYARTHTIKDAANPQR